eukprot:5711294-Pyramimonas_sp.AAC.1
MEASPLAPARAELPCRGPQGTDVQRQVQGARTPLLTVRRDGRHCLPAPVVHGVRPPHNRPRQHHRR